MPPDPQLEALAERVAAFHITDRAMSQAQASIQRAIASDEVGEDALRRYLAAVRRYFGAFEREARAHLRDVDRRLEHANQVQFNLAAERGVAVKRIEVTQGVLANIASIEVQE